MEQMGQIGGEENEWIARQKKNKQYEPITNPASKTSDFGQGVQKSTMVTDYMALRMFYFYILSKTIYPVYTAVIKKQ